MTIQKYGDPKNDMVFKKLFGDKKNQDLLIDFINKLLPNKHVKSLEYVKTNLEPEIRAKKQSILDVLCTDENGDKYIIEMQNAKEKGFEKRAVYYASKTYATQANKSGRYADLKEVIFIAIANFIMFADKADYVSHHAILDTETYQHDLKDMFFVFIELPKFKRFGAKLVDGWCDIFKNAAKYKEPKTNDPLLLKAYHMMEMSNWTEQELLDYQAYEKIIMDNLAREDQVRDEGIERGRAERDIEIARNMLIDGISIEKIAKLTGLNKEELKKL